MFEYVLVVFLDNHPTYQGSFSSCAQANNWVLECIYNHKELYVTCQHQDYLFLPEGFVAYHPEGCSKD